MPAPQFGVSAQRPTPRARPAVSSPRPLRRLLPRIRPFLARLAVAFVCLLGSASIALAFPQIVRRLLDAAFISADSSLLNRIAIGLLVLFAIQALLNFVQVETFSKELQEAFDPASDVEKPVFIMSSKVPRFQDSAQFITFS